MRAGKKKEGHIGIFLRQYFYKEGGRIDAVRVEGRCVNDCRSGHPIKFAQLKAAAFQQEFESFS